VLIHRRGPLGLGKPIVKSEDLIPITNDYDSQRMFPELAAKTK
jgi:hypothetical protein